MVRGTHQLGVVFIFVHFLHPLLVADEEGMFVRNGTVDQCVGARHLHLTVGIVLLIPAFFQLLLERPYPILWW